MIHSLPDEAQQCQAILHSMLPRESSSKVCLNIEHLSRFIFSSLLGKRLIRVQKFGQIHKQTLKSWIRLLLIGLPDEGLNCAIISKFLTDQWMVICCRE